MAKEGRRECRPLAEPALGLPRVVSAAQEPDRVHGCLPAIGTGDNVVEFEEPKAKVPPAW
jgi:hypothetical protein